MYWNIAQINSDIQKNPKIYTAIYHFRLSLSLKLIYLSYLFPVGCTILAQLIRYENPIIQINIYAITKMEVKNGINRIWRLFVIITADV